MVIVKLQGGLGNQMFQYSCALVLAKKLKCECKVDFSGFDKDTLRRTFDLDIFGILPVFASEVEKLRFTKHSTLSKYISKIFPFIYRYKIVKEPIKDWRYMPGFQNLSGHIYLDGYWQSPKYFEGFQAEIRNLFDLSKLKLNPVSHILWNEINNGISVCINVRRTDFVTNSVIGFVGTEYYRKAYDKMNTNVPNARYYIFSDDLNWCMQNLDFIKNATFVGHEHAGDKFSSYLKLMYACKYFVIPNSSFAWWAAWLTESKVMVIAPEKYLLDPEYQIDIIPDCWIKL